MHLIFFLYINTKHVLQEFEEMTIPVVFMLDSS